MRHTDNDKLTELSAALDAVNRGETPDSRDDDIRELAAVAQLLKRSGPPPAVVADLADTLSAELAAKKRRRLWFASGAAGTAAAALLVIALNTGPSAPSQPPPTIPPPGSVVIQTVPQQAPEAAKAAADEAPPAKQPAPAAQEAAPVPPAREAAPAKDRPAAVKENRQAEQRMMLAKAPDKTAERAAGKAAAAFLVWPGHDPDAITADKAAGTISQVYGSGDSAVVITQRAAGGSAPAARDEAVTGPASGKTNRVTLTVKGFVVTVEGNLPVEELQKIARSLE